LMNFLLAFVLFLSYVVMSGTPTAVRLGKVEAGSPAEKSGMQENDIVLAVNGQAIGTDRNKLTAIIQDAQNKPMVWNIERAGAQKQLNVTARETTDGYKVGIGLEWKTRPVSAGEAIKGAWDSSANSVTMILNGFKQLAFGQVKMDDLGGPVRIVQVSSEFALAGAAAMLFWTANLSMYLGLFNLLPIPALDGSRLVFIGIEALRGKPIDPNRESMVHFIGFAMLMVLMIAVTYNDILRLIKG
jgi:regulator of sigma E protease